VERVEYLGSDRLVYGVVVEDAEEKLTIAKLPSTVTVPIEEEKIHDFVIEEQHLKFFDKETGLKTPPQPLSV
jgi:multiple sugar transport system ATP-binding protein